MRTIENATDKIVYFDERVYLQERQLITYTDLTNTATSVGIWSSTESREHPLAVFILNANKTAFIDVTDFIRAYGQVGQLTIASDADGSAEYMLAYTRSGLTDPYKAFIPCHGVSGMVVTPPKMIYAGGQSVAVMSQGLGIIVMTPSGRVVLTPNSMRNIDASGDFTIEGRIGVIGSYTMRAKVDGHRYALIRWVSRFGFTQRLVWEVVGNNSEVNTTISLASFDQDYNTIKGYEEGFTLFLDNLSSYDYWFYSDIVTSSKVEVSFDDGVTYRQVEIETKSVTIPDGDAGQMNELKIPIKYRSYDAVDM